MRSRRTLDDDLSASKYEPTFATPLYRKRDDAFDLSMKPLPLRLLPNTDLRRALEATLAAHACNAAFVVGGIGSLHRARLRLAGKAEPEVLNGDLEILTLAGSISADGAHLHMSLADAAGRVMGGHVGYDCVVRTTAEVLLVLLPEWSFGRKLDRATGYAELVLRAVPPGNRQA